MISWIFLGQLNQTLSSYISGQAIECLFVGTFTIIGYSLLGVRYAFFYLVSLPAFTNLIPYLGPYLGLALAVLVTIFNEPVKSSLMLFSGASGSTIGRKYYLSKRYRKISKKIHPLTIIFNFIGSRKFSGFARYFPRCPILRNLPDHYLLCY